MGTRKVMDKDGDGLEKKEERYQWRRMGSHWRTALTVSVCLAKHRDSELGGARG